VLFARLKAELRHGHATPISDDLGRSVVRGRLRALAERTWIVRLAAVRERRPGLRGALLYPIKLVVGRLVGWYVTPLALGQRSFNDAILKLADELFEEVDLLFGRLRELETELERRREDEAVVARLEERVLRLERERRRSGRSAERAAGTVAVQPRASAIPDYFAFEVQMRGLSKDVRARQHRYVGALQDCAPVLDVGCGRGELIGLLREAGVEARGVDADCDMVRHARAEGLQVEQADAIEYLRAVPRGSLGAVFSAQVVEHLPPPVLLRFLELAATRLRPDGLLLIETINPLSPLALRNYFADLTHAQPLVPETLSLLAQHAGFRDVEITYLNAPGERLVDVELPDGEEFDGTRRAVSANVRRLNEVLFAPLDYALSARTLPPLAPEPVAC
jgi:2-polyprenyl-3-methyl-5-hydroxy-6-metoxy-1,4-benzoquinol methylase